MINIIIIGFGSHVRKNILPLFNRMKRKVTILKILATKARKENVVEEGQEYSTEQFDSTALVGMDWVYIATPISTHGKLIRKALEKNSNVVCEKVLTHSLSEAEKLFTYAESRGKKLYEVCMYRYHKQYIYLENFIKQNKILIRQIDIEFKIPHIDPENIRYKDKEGGALYDLGYYPISLAVSLFSVGLPKEYKILQENPYQTNTKGCASWVINGIRVNASWAIGDEYSNKATVFLDESKFIFERIFSKPHDFETILKCNTKAANEEIYLGSDDQFKNMFDYYFSEQGYEEERDRTLAVIKILSFLRSSKSHA